VISQYVAEPSDVCHGAQVNGEVDVMLQCSNSGKSVVVAVRYVVFSTVKRLHSFICCG
jgi:hypothetical protein